MEEKDFELCFYRAAGMLGLSDFVNVAIEDYASLKTSAFREGGKIEIKTSREFLLLPENETMGLALSILSKISRRQLGPNELEKVKDFKKFCNSESAFKLLAAKKLQRSIGKKVEEDEGLKAKRDEIMQKYESISQISQTPTIKWSKSASKRILGSYCLALNSISISRILSRPFVPNFVLEYVIYHELLHAKLQVKFRKEGGKKIHFAQFKEEEKKFEKFSEAENWIKRNIF